MAKAEATVEELVGMIGRGCELRLPEMQRRYVWRAPRVRDLLDSLYRGYPLGAILLWDTDDLRAAAGVLRFRTRWQDDDTDRTSQELRRRLYSQQLNQFVRASDGIVEPHAYA